MKKIMFTVNKFNSVDTVALWQYTQMLCPTTLCPIMYPVDTPSFRVNYGLHGIYSIVIEETLDDLMLPILFPWVTLS